jgi:hypothetical protein
MALTITSAENVRDTTSSASQTTGATINAAVGDWLIAQVSADNNGTNGASSISSVQDSSGNTWTQRALINQDPGAAAAGATLAVYTCAVTVALVNGTVTANFSPNTTSKSTQVYQAVPGAGEAVQFVAAYNTTDASSASSTATHSAPTVSVNNGDTIFGFAAIETNATATGDSDTTNGSWSTLISRLSDTGTDATSMRGCSQWKTVNATGNQDWACTTVSSKDSARSYLVIGPIANAKTLTADAGSFSLTGTAATLRKGKVLAAAAGSFSLTGTSAGLKHGWKVPAAAGSYVLTGTAAGLKHGWKLPAASGSFALTGTAATLIRKLPLVAGAGSYVLTGTAAALRQSRKIAATSGSFTLTGTDAGVKHGWRVIAGAGSYVLTGTDAALTKAGNKLLAAGAGSFAPTGTKVGLRVSHLIAASSGSFTITGTAASLLLKRKLTAGSGTYTITGTDVTFTLGAGLNGPVRPRVGASGIRARATGVAAKGRVSGEGITASAVAPGPNTRVKSSATTSKVTVH